METNTCNIDHLDADSHLPPRKRLLAGLKRQNSDVNSAPPPSTPSSAVSENGARLNHALKSQWSNPDLSSEEIVEASRIAAMKAAKLAEAARANAEEKAAKAAKAVAAAKSALDLVAILSDEAANKEKFLKRSKMKKHVTVEALYNKNKGSTNCRTDEELARNLHRVINSSPRILNNSSSSDVKSHKHKRLKSSASSGIISITSGVPDGEGDRPSTVKINGNGVVGILDAESPIKKIDVIVVDLNVSKHDIDKQLEVDDGEGSRLGKSDVLKLDNGEILDRFGKKRGRMKQKKLPLSICSFKDQSNYPKNKQVVQVLEGNAVVEKQPLFCSNGLERTSMWKCQSLKANKIKLCSHSVDSLI